MQGEAGQDRRLRRILALLLSLAGHAEQAAGRCFAVRFIVLLVLRRAEAVARDYVADATGVGGLWFDDGMEATSSPQDAALLAERFRLLADELVALLDAAPPTGCARSGLDPTRRTSGARPSGARLRHERPALRRHAPRACGTGPPRDPRSGLWPSTSIRTETRRTLACGGR